MDAIHRNALNLLISAIAVAVTYAIGIAAQLIGVAAWTRGSSQIPHLENRCLRGSHWP
jgi:hypothetical protein